MNPRKAVCVLTVLLLASVPLALAQGTYTQIDYPGAAQEKVLHSFNENGVDGYSPSGALIFDTSGNLYGTTLFGGSYNLGSVFELDARDRTETVLYSFSGSTNDGYSPFGDLIFDSTGNLYGTTFYGGAYYGGIVFELTPTVGGNWTETILHNFEGGTDGSQPHSGLIFDNAGNLYGTTFYGGAGTCTNGNFLGCGTIFELTPSDDGSWTEQVLFSFNDADGSYPNSGLVFGSDGNLYGTTGGGGRHRVGTVFELAPGVGGVWTEKVLHTFSKNHVDGYAPLARLIFDSAGNLYGTTLLGGAHTAGAVFELTPDGSGRWRETVLHSFNDTGTDGYEPTAGLIFDSAGRLYGTTTLGGTYGEGTVFELAPTTGAGWRERLLYAFPYNDTNGRIPQAGVVFDAAGNLYGTTLGGGAYGNYGTVFEIKH
jgi:uncharacterized repeat protein (TIGR03803 family)